MPRYYEKFYNEEPMREISEDEARARPWYVEEVEGPPLHYRQYSGGRLELAIYSGYDDPAPAVADYRARYEDIPVEVHSPVSAGAKIAWRRWEYDASGTLQRIVGYELDPRSPAWAEFLYRPDGTLVGHQEHVHDEYGLLEVITYDALGKIVKREDAD